MHIAKWGGILMILGGVACSSDPVVRSDPVIFPKFQPILKQDAAKIQTPQIETYSDQKFDDPFEGMILKEIKSKPAVVNDDFYYVNNERIYAKHEPDDLGLNIDYLLCGDKVIVFNVRGKWANISNSEEKPYWVLLSDLAKNPTCTKGKVATTPNPFKVKSPTIYGGLKDEKYLKSPPKKYVPYVPVVPTTTIKRSAPRAGIFQNKQKYTCSNVSTYCYEMSSCQEALVAYKCGNYRLDRDNDGIPCDKLCQ